VVELPVERRVSGVYIEAAGLDDYLRQQGVAYPDDRKITILIHDEYNAMNFRGYQMLRAESGSRVYYKANGMFDVPDDVYAAPVQVSTTPNFYLVGGTPYPGEQTDIRIYYDEQELPCSPVSTPDMRLIDGLLNLFKLDFEHGNAVEVDVTHTTWDGQQIIDKGV
jgi:hypothetical protein